MKLQPIKFEAILDKVDHIIWGQEGMIILVESIDKLMGCP